MTIWRVISILLYVSLSSDPMNEPPRMLHLFLLRSDYAHTARGL